MKIELKNQWVYVLVLYVFYTVGIIGHGIEQTLPLMLTLTPWTLLIFGLLVIYPYFKDFSLNQKLYLFFAYGVTLALEIMGVKTGLVFGQYQYGQTLGLQFMSVPLIIGFNWVVVIFGAHSFISLFLKHPVLRIVLTGLICFVFDYIMEPIAITLDYWTWAGGDIPLQNYIAWTLIAAITSIGLEIFPIKTNKTLIINYFFIQVVFFVFLHFLL